MRIVADSATLYSPQEGQQQGITIIPVCVAINNRTYKDYEEISSAEFLKQIEAGGVPTSSQPSIGDILDVLEDSEDETLLLTVGDGLSGAYQTAMGAKNAMEHSEHIHIINSKTLAGPLRYLAKKALALKEQGLALENIQEQLQLCIESSLSFVIPADFEFLKRSGRLTPFTAKVGGALNLLPVLTQTEDKTRITPIAVKRSWKSAVNCIIQRLCSVGVGEQHLISVCHGGSYQKALTVAEQIKEQLRDAEIEILELSPALITHGGPGCIVVQSILK